MPSSVALAVQKAAAFTMPGMTLGIFPVGLFVTAAWIILFVAAFGWGTFGRISSRKEYRAHKSTAAPTPVEMAKHDSVPPLRRFLSRQLSNSKRPRPTISTPIQTAKPQNIPPIKRMLSRKLSDSKRPAVDSTPARKESRSKKNEPMASVVEMVDYEITYDKTFGERPNYYLENLPSHWGATRECSV